MNHKQIMDFIFGHIGEHPSDNELVKCANACATARISLLSIIEDERIREATLVKENEQLADCVRRITQALDAIENGEAAVIKTN